MLTEKQIHNVSKLPKEDLLQLMHECAEVLGVLSVQEYAELTFTPKRTVYAKIKQEEIKCFEISGHLFPLFNCD